ncbi:MAG: glycosyltransferase family 4 protein [Gemmatimonadetes bacterium]|nr:glycosyltransferase family 4 protein [Gemmatimonadota bacterium]
MRVLALVPHSAAVASVRFRVAQYREPLARRGIGLELASFFGPQESRHIYGPSAQRAVRATLRGYLRRLMDLRRVRQYDAVLVHREIAPYGNGVLADRLATTGVPYFYDFDDAIYLPAVGARHVTRLLRSARRETDLLCRRAAAVLAGNPFLAEFARRRGVPVEVLPTVVDTAVFRPAEAPPERPVIVWVGSHTTERYVESIAGPLSEVCRATGAQVRLVSQGARERIGSLAVEGVAWRLEDDARYYREATVGVYPLEDDEWGRGKCGLKALLFLASGVPVVASPVGVLNEIVIPGQTGFLARGSEEWHGHLMRLLMDEGLRRGMAGRGRRLVEERYSLEVGADILAAVLRLRGGTRGAAASSGATRGGSPCAESPES